MDPSVLFAYAAVAAGLVVLPGPDWALVLAAGMRGRGPVVVPTVGGLALGYVLLTGAVAAGVAPVVAAAPSALVVLTMVGAAYLVYLGVSTLRSAHRAGYSSHEVDAPSRASLVLQGLGVSALNPKSLLFFLAFLPQFARPSAPWPLVVQLIVLGGIWVALVAVIYTFLGRSAARTIARHTRVAGVVTRVAGFAMLGAGVVLLAEQLLT